MSGYSPQPGQPFNPAFKTYKTMTTTSKTLRSPLSEANAVPILTRLFKRAGYTITNNIRVTLGNVEVTLDGWDEQSRVGFEYLTSEHNDHLDLSLEEFQELAAAQSENKYHILVLDEVEAQSEDELREYAQAFLQSLPKRKSRKKEPLKKLLDRLDQLESRVRLLEQTSPQLETFPGYQPNRTLEVPAPQQPNVICGLTRPSC